MRKWWSHLEQTMPLRSSSLLYKASEQLGHFTHKPSGEPESLDFRIFFGVSISRVNQLINQQTSFFVEAPFAGAWFVLC